MNKILIPLLLPLLLLSIGCQSRNVDDAISLPAESVDSAVESQWSKQDEEAVSDDSSLMYKEDAEKYFDYFLEHNHITHLLGDKTGEEGFSDSEMAGYALSELISLDNGGYDQAVGYPKEEFDAVVLKYFGSTIQNYENQKSTVIPETGHITSTGWSRDTVALVLKELDKGADDVFTGVFYLFNFGIDDIQPEMKDYLLQGRFDDHKKPESELVTIVFEEKVSENGDRYLRYLDVM